MITRIILQRRPFVENEPTLGTFMIEENRSSVRLAGIRSIELPWKDNAKSISCIAASEDLRLEWTRSNRFSAMKGYDVWMWQVSGTEGRAGIRIHSGNYAGPKLSDSLGCILPCRMWSDINKDGILDGVQSKEAMNELLKLLEPFKSSGIAFSVRNGEVKKT